MHTDSRDLDGVSPSWNTDVGIYSEYLAGQCDALTMVPGAGCDYASFLLLGAELADEVDASPDLEGSCGVIVLVFDVRGESQKLV
jgi:hypothetical protein